MSIDLTGQRFGRLVAIRQVGRRWSSALWECRCDCGKMTQVATMSLRNGDTRSCGCYQRERTSEAHKKHGESTSRLYYTWRDMVRRCNNPNIKFYHDYGGRGIRVCDEWQDSYEAFRDWALASGYQDDLTIERVDVDGDYCPENCTWIPKSEQARNRRSNVYVVYQDERYILSDLAKKVGIKKSVLRYRLLHGWSVEDAIEIPVDKGNKRLRKKKSCPTVSTTAEQQAKKVCAGVIVTPKEDFVNYGNFI